MMIILWVVTSEHRSSTLIIVPTYNFSLVNEIYNH